MGPKYATLDTTSPAGGETVVSDPAAAAAREAAQTAARLAAKRAADHARRVAAEELIRAENAARELAKVNRTKTADAQRVAAARKDYDSKSGK